MPQVLFITCSATWIHRKLLRYISDQWRDKKAAQHTRFMQRHIHRLLDLGIGWNKKCRYVTARSGLERKGKFSFFPNSSSERLRNSPPADASGTYEDKQPLHCGKESWKSEENERRFVAVAARRCSSDLNTRRHCFWCSFWRAYDWD